MGECVAVLGATGFVGAAVCKALQARGATVLPVPAPRLPPCTEEDALSAAYAQEVSDQLRSAVESCYAVVNAAGISESGEADTGRLMAANGALPGVVARATHPGQRLVHISSAAVQGRAKVLDDSAGGSPFSPYSLAKLVGELAVHRSRPDAVVYRPPGVHGPNRRVTQSVARMARSALATVASPGQDPTAQALIDNVADAVSFLATTPQAPPPIVTHPSEGLTTSGLLEALGGRPPRRVPRPLALCILALARESGRISAPVAANARRLEVLWFGQRQAASWLTQAGWTPPAAPEQWQTLGAQLRSRSVQEETQ